MFQLRQIKPYIFPWEKQESHPFGDGFDLGKDESSLGKKHRKYLKRWAPTSCKWSFFFPYKWPWSVISLVRTLSPRIMVQWKMAGYLQGNDPIWDIITHIYTILHPFFTEPWWWEEDGGRVAIAVESVSSLSLRGQKHWTLFDFLFSRWRVESMWFYPCSLSLDMQSCFWTWDTCSTLSTVPLHINQHRLS